MNLNYLTSPTRVLELLRETALAHAATLPGLKECTEVEALPGGYLHVRWQRCQGVGAHIDVHVECSTVEHQPGTRHTKEVWARVSPVTVKVGVTQQTTLASVAVAQATLHRAVAELRMRLEAMLSELTVGVPCDERGRELADG